jgi:altronate hydrolase
MLSDSDWDSGFPASADAGSTLLFQTCGAHLTVLTSGRGHVISNPIAPTIKITGNSRTYEAMKGDFDLNAGSLLSGERNRRELLAALLDLIARVAGGEKTCGEALGHAEYILNYENQSEAITSAYGEGVMACG